MSLSVGRCLWDGVGQAQRPDCRANDQRAPAANLLRCPQFADTGVSFAGRDRWRWDKYGGVYSMVSTALSGQEAAHALGWRELSPRGRIPGVSRAGECRLA